MRQNNISHHYGIRKNDSPLKRKSHPDVAASDMAALKVNNTLPTLSGGRMIMYISVIKTHKRALFGSIVRQYIAEISDKQPERRFLETIAWKNTPVRR